MIRSLAAGLAAALGLAAPAAAATDFSWTGGAGVTAPRWSAPSNWSTNVSPSGSIGTLTFPALTNCGSSSCEASTDDLAGLGANGLSLALNGGYAITGSQLSIGAGGVTADSAQPTSPVQSLYDSIGDPIQLTDPQTWSLAQSNADSEAQLAFTGGVTGASEPLSLKLGVYSTLVLGPDTEVGPISVTGPGELAIGTDRLLSQSTGTNPGAINATDGNPITLGPNARLITGYLPNVGTLNVAGDVGLSASTGPITSNGGIFQPTGTIAVHGNLELDASSDVILEVRGHQSPDQLAATGNVSLGTGAQLLLVGLVPALAANPLQPGETFPLVSAAGTLTGTFANAPAGTLENIGDADEPVQIQYTPQAVIGNVVDMSVSTSTPTPVTDQPVTLTTSGVSNYPTGNVTFGVGASAASASPLTGCVNEPLNAGGGGSGATCAATFAHAGTQTLQATITQPDPRLLPVQGDGTVTVKPALTDLAVAPSVATTAPISSRRRSGPSVTYDETLDPEFAGPTDPTGSLALRDNGKPVAACARAQLTPKGAAERAHCTVRYTHPGRHRIIASYTGDANFAGSASTPLKLVVPAANTGGARRVSRTTATLHGTIRDEHAAVSWRFEYWRSARHVQHTRPRRLSGRSNATAVSVPLTGLRPATRYRFRVITTTVRRRGTQPVTWTGRTLGLRTHSR